MYEFYPNNNPLVEPFYVLTYGYKFLLLERRKRRHEDEWEIIFQFRGV